MSSRSMKKAKRRGLDVQHLGDSWIEQAMLQKYIEATRELKACLKTSQEEASVVSGGVLDAQGLDEDAQPLFHHKKHGQAAWL